MNALHLSRPHAIMLVGLPGSGKSTFAEQFSVMFQIPYVDIQEVQRLTGDNSNTETVILYFLDQLIKSSQTFIFEGNSASKLSRTEFAKWAESKGYQPLFVWVQTDPGACKIRIMKSKKMTKPAFEKAIQNFSAPEADNQTVVISGKHTYTTQARVVLARLGDINRSVAEKPKMSARSSIKGVTRK